MKQSATTKAALPETLIVRYLHGGPGNVAYIYHDNEALGQCKSREIAAELVRRWNAHQKLVGALSHMRWCATCADGAWEDCDRGGKEASAILAESQLAAQLERPA